MLVAPSYGEDRADRSILGVSQQDGELQGGQIQKHETKPNEGKDPEIKEPDVQKGEAKTVADWFISVRDSWSGDLNAMATSVDRFFAGDNVQERYNKTYGKIGFAQVFQKRGEHITNNRLRLHLDLPNTEHRWKLIFETDRLEDQSLLQQQTDVPLDDVKISDDEGTSGALRFVFNEYKRWKLDADLGLKTPLPLDPFIRLQARRKKDLGAFWRVKFGQTFYQYGRLGFVNRTRLSFERAISDDYFLRNTLQARFVDKDNNWEFSETLSTFHILDEKHVMDYAVGVVAQSEPLTQVTNYYISAKLRKLLYKKWFYLDIQPVLAFPRSDDFKLNPSIMFRIEVVFEADSHQ